MALQWLCLLFWDFLQARPLALLALSWLIWCVHIPIAEQWWLERSGWGTILHRLDIFYLCGHPGEMTHGSFAKVIRTRCQGQW